jgi:hypothetical protein
MTAVQFLSALYAVSGFAACACYVPQLWKLARDAGARRSMSLASWAGWLAVGCVTMLYAAVVVGQTEMMMVVGLNTLCQTTVVLLVAGQRIRDRRATAGKAVSPVSPSW